MRFLIMLPFVLLVVPTSLAEVPIDTAFTIRSAVVRAEAAQASGVVAQLAANTKVEIYARQGLWVRLAVADDADAKSGWLRFTELRFGAGDGNAAASEAPRSGGFAGFSRSVSGFLSSFRRSDSRTAQRTSTIGIRGLTVADLEAARPDTNALATINRYAISKTDAEQFAGAGGLAAHAVPYGGGQ